jgi:hypothetical protein
MPVLKHTHTYGRWKERGGEMNYKCLDPQCSHFAPRSLVVGKLTKCSKCTNTLIFDWKQAERAKALCIECQDTKEGRAFRARKESTRALLGAIYGKDEEGHELINLEELEKENPLA